jgi:hypothetical protein
MTRLRLAPNRRRRRIVVGILVLVLGLGRWLWPRVDQRLVGTWELDHDSNGLAGFRLSADGSAEIASNLTVVGYDSLPRPWKVEGGILFISQQSTEYIGLGGRIALQMQSAWERFIRPSEAFSQERIVEVTANSLTLSSLDEPGYVSKHHRLPDGAKINTHPMRLVPWNP